LGSSKQETPTFALPAPGIDECFGDHVLLRALGLLLPGLNGEHCELSLSGSGITRSFLLLSDCSGRATTTSRARRIAATLLEGVDI
jgi:hypothetical protein